MVQFVNIRKLKNHASAIIRQASRGDIIVTSRGQPKVILHAIDSETLEDYLLANSAKFRKSLNTSYKEYRRKGGKSLEKLLAQTERELAKLQR